jgi:hypothetical protein
MTEATGDLLAAYAVSVSRAVQHGHGEQIRQSHHPGTHPASEASHPAGFWRPGGVS